MEHMVRGLIRTAGADVMAPGCDSKLLKYIWRQELSFLKVDVSFNENQTDMQILWDGIQ